MIREIQAAGITDPILVAAVLGEMGRDRRQQIIHEERRAGTTPARPNQDALPPSPKQVKYLEDMAGQLGIRIVPPRTRAAASALIEDYQQRMRAKRAGQ